MNSWEDELRQHFPGYLLPASALQALPRDAAQRFLERIGWKPDAVTLLLAASALSPVADIVRAFAIELELVARVLPSRTEVERAENEGIVRGRIDAPGTVRTRLAGHHGNVVSRVRQRSYDLLENVFLVVVAERLVGLLEKLEDSRVIVAKDGKEGWTIGFRDCAEKIKHTLASTILREVPRRPLETLHEQAAGKASGAAYSFAIRLHTAFRRMDAADAQEIAQMVADGALAPFDEATRFEIAVLIRLGRSIEQALAGKGYETRRALIEKDRDHVFEFLSGDDCLRIHYNQRCFDTLGPRDRGILHYFDESGRFRPDITIELWEKGKRKRATIVEVKHSPDKKYLKEGYEQALLYRNEYSNELGGWPKVILVVSAQNVIKGRPRVDDEVIAVDWANWVPDIVMNGLLDGFGAATTTSLVG